LVVLAALTGPRLLLLLLLTGLLAALLLAALLLLARFLIRVLALIHVVMSSRLVRRSAFD
jgi:hypothetical protein